MIKIHCPDFDRRTMVKEVESVRGDADPSGPWMWENARLAKAGSPPVGALEIGFYTDSWRVDLQGNAGPLTFLNQLYNVYPADYPLGAHSVGLMVRVEQYVDRILDEYLDDAWEQSDQAVFHGGDASDELAALVSLAIGERIRSAGIARVFSVDDDDLRGQPHVLRERIPYISPSRFVRVLPHVGARHRPDVARSLNLLDLYAHLSPNEARALVRAARTYQEALWIAEADPRQAWLRLVNAVEIIAQLAPDIPADARLVEAFSDAESSAIVGRLIATEDDELIEWVAKRLADQGRSTKKFLNFLQKYQPRQPPGRPTVKAAQVDWANMRKHFRRVYEYRSNDLHAGIPFPASMCAPPRRTSQNTPYEVAPEAKGDRGSSLILLHTFEYVVRGAIQKWWLLNGRKKAK
ncbi:hypothetical protein [Actinokineospora sp. NPDC004072]